MLVLIRPHDDESIDYPKEKTIMKTQNTRASGTRNQAQRLAALGAALLLAAALAACGGGGGGSTAAPSVPPTTVVTPVTPTTPVVVAPPAVTPTQWSPHRQQST